MLYSRKMPKRFNARVPAFSDSEFYTNRFSTEMHSIVDIACNSPQMIIENKPSVPKHIISELTARKEYLIELSVEVHTKKYSTEMEYDQLLINHTARSDKTRWEFFQGKEEMEMYSAMVELFTEDIKLIERELEGIEMVLKNEPRKRPCRSDVPEEPKKRRCE